MKKENRERKIRLEEWLHTYGLAISAVVAATNRRQLNRAEENLRLASEKLATIAIELSEANK